ncbi:hypothetical protein VTL71DRAFT_6257 [Oculimacula yallundae]|uniref:GST C-terminal domain-containing protein n=1 Tax=Oculimacula yallundae TaxID=86028 RepID=A0ABR4C002_9HELO
MTDPSGKATKESIYNIEKENGTFKRQVSSFRSWISAEPGAQFPPESDRYVLYINLGCPWASRANLVRTLKGLEDIIQVVILDWELFPEGWSFTGRDGTHPADPLYGFTRLSQLYLKAEPNYSARFTVPVLWDKKTETMVSNESSEIIRMFYSAFDDLIPAERRESAKSNGGLLPPRLLREIDEMNSWIYDTINNGVYKAGFADTQEAYETHVLALFKSLDRVEDILAKSNGKYLFGDQLTDADIRLFPTIVRFDVAYHTLFMCNLKMIRYDYPCIQKWLVGLYWDESEETKGAFRKSTNFDAIKKGYAHTPRKQHTPIGPAVNMLS